MERFRICEVPITKTYFFKTKTYFFKRPRAGLDDAITAGETYVDRVRDWVHAAGCRQGTGNRTKPRPFVTAAECRPLVSFSDSEVRIISRHCAERTAKFGSTAEMYAVLIRKLSWRMRSKNEEKF